MHVYSTIYRFELKKSDDKLLAVGWKRLLRHESLPTNLVEKHCVIFLKNNKKKYVFSIKSLSEN